MQQSTDLFDVIHFEAPQIRQFYNDFLQNSQKTPQKQSDILKILVSPMNFKFKEEPNDLFNELLEQENKFKSPFSRNMNHQLFPQMNLSYLIHEMKRLPLEKSKVTIENIKLDKIPLEIIRKKSIPEGKSIHKYI